MYGKIIWFCVIFRVFSIEARVYCGDPNANNLTFVGFSCPLKCANVIAVVEQLKIVDYHRLLDEGREKLKTSSGFNIRFAKLRNRKNVSQNIQTFKATRRLFDEYSKVLTSDKILNYLNKELKHYIYLVKLNKAYCHRTAKDNITNSFFIDQCLRRSPYENDFVRRFTRFLNSYSKRQFRFSKSMVVLLLRKILGTEMDLRQGELLAPKIVLYLREAMERTSNEVTIVHLSPRHCLNVFVPGCYCKEGFLERTGQCITLDACLHEGNKDLSSYLKRVIIH